MDKFSIIGCEIWWIKAYDLPTIYRKSIVKELKEMSKQIGEAIDYVKNAKSRGFLADVILWLETETREGRYGVKVTSDYNFSIRIFNNGVAGELPDVAYIISKKLGIQEYPLLEVEKEHIILRI